MSIGSDIEDVLEELGSSIVILRDSGNIEGEFATIETMSQATKPLVISFFKNCTLSYATSVVQGDIINFETTDDKYLVTTLNAEEFENSIITKEGILYLCNVSGELLRPSGEIWNTHTYHKEQAFEVIKSNCYALLVNPEFRNKLVEEESVMVSMEEDEIYLPSSVGISINDRYEATSGEYYKIMVVNSYRYMGVDVCSIGKDTR